VQNHISFLAWRSEIEHRFAKCPNSPDPLSEQSGTYHCSRSIPRIPPIPVPGLASLPRSLLSCSRERGTSQRSNCRLRKTISKGTMAHHHWSHETQAERINRSRLTHSNAQPTSVMVPLIPTSSVASGYSSVLTRPRSM